MSSSDGGILAEGETSSETSRGSEDSPPCDLGLVERLLLTHPVWFLPGIQRSGAVHFLQGKEEGVSIRFTTTHELHIFFAPFLFLQKHEYARNLYKNI